MGILNRTPDSFYDRGATWDFDAFLRRAEELVADGADLLDVGGVKAGPGPEVGEAEELDRVVPAIAALHERFDVPLSVDTWRASVLDAACRAGAVVGNDISGFADPDYLARRGRSTTRPSSPPTSGCGRASPIPTRTTTISSPTSPRSCSSAPRRAEAVGPRARADRARRRPRSRQDAGAERGAAARVGAARRARLPAAAVGVEQAVHRRAARPRDRRPARRSRSRRSRTASRAVAGSCACTTCSGTARVCRTLEALLVRRDRAGRGGVAS